jgi:hypothetical protein
MSPELSSTNRISMGGLASMVSLMPDFLQWLMTGSNALSKSLIPPALIASLTAPRVLSLPGATPHPTPPERRAPHSSFTVSLESRAESHADRARPLRGDLADQAEAAGPMPDAGTGSIGARRELAALTAQYRKAKSICVN